MDARNDNTPPPPPPPLHHHYTHAHTTTTTTPGPQVRGAKISHTNFVGLNNFSSFCQDVQRINDMYTSTE